MRSIIKTAANTDLASLRQMRPRSPGGNWQQGSSRRRSTAPRISLILQRNSSPTHFSSVSTSPYQYLEPMVSHYISPPGTRSMRRCLYLVRMTWKLSNAFLCNGHPRLPFNVIPGFLVIISAIKRVEYKTYSSTLPKTASPLASYLPPG